MSDAGARTEDAREIDRDTAGSNPDLPDKVVVPCRGCRESIDTEYYSINGNAFCGRCRAAVESLTETPEDLPTLAKAALFGVGASIGGAALYFAVMAFAHLQIGIVAIVIGYLVGRAVRKGAGNRGGRRFQILAVVLTYASIALAYAPFTRAAPAERTRATSHSSGEVRPEGPAPLAPGGVAPLLRLSASWPLCPSSRL